MIFLIKRLVLLLVLCVSHGTLAAPSLLSPDTTGEVPLFSTSAEFVWQDDAGSATEYWLYVGNTAAGFEYYNSGSLGTATSTYVSGIPLLGSDVFVTLWYRETGISGWNSVEYTISTDDIGFNGPRIVEVNVDDEVGIQVEWFHAFTPATRWWVTAGPEPGSTFYVNSGSLGPESYRYENNAGTLPTPYPVSLYTSLWYRLFGVWESRQQVDLVTGEYAYSPSLLEIDGSEVPAEGETITGPNPLLTLWDPQYPTTKITEFWVTVGATPESSDASYYSSGSLPYDGAASTYPVTVSPSSTLAGTGNLPENGSSVYITIWYRIDESIGDPDRWYRQTNQFLSSSNLP